jgi:hypothetical protein
VTVCNVPRHSSRFRGSSKSLHFLIRYQRPDQSPHGLSLSCDNKMRCGSPRSYFCRQKLMLDRFSPCRVILATRYVFETPVPSLPSLPILPRTPPIRSRQTRNRTVKKDIPAEHAKHNKDLSVYNEPPPAYTCHSHW